MEEWGEEGFERERWGEGERNPVRWRERETRAREREADERFIKRKVKMM